jgi:hypothetical protein
MDKFRLFSEIDPLEWITGVLSPSVGQAECSGPSGQGQQFHSPYVDLGTFGLKHYLALAQARFSPTIDNLSIHDIRHAHLVTNDF